MVLQITDIAIDRGGRRIVDGVSFEARPGEIIRLSGPNGVGKTTLLRCIAGFIPTQRGSIRLFGNALGDAEDQIHLSGHLDAIKPQLSVRENVMFWARLLHGDADHALDALALDGIADRPAHACSAGQKRRLGLARLLLGDRKLWLMDEPTVSLDTEAVQRVASLIATHAASGGIAVVATHIELGLTTMRDLVLSPVAYRETIEADPFLTGDIS